ncbi:acetyl-CoA C-acyltransferase [Terasakiella pusilla]|uniref:acetyl-CoA C-acyltransferase n=1 Tax=Terasakiella pusilla TaxID=64973 RepID=UPI003AA7BC26
MSKAVIVSTARTPIGKAYRGAFNNLAGPSLAAHAMKAAVERAKIDPAQIEDVIMGCALTQGSTGVNVARHAALAAGFGVGVAGATVDRQCASGLSAIAMASTQVACGDADVVLAGGMDSISLVQNEHFDMYRYKDPAVERDMPSYYDSMLETAQTVARAYNVSRDEQDIYALLSQQRTANAQAAGLFAQEIIPVTATKMNVDRETGETSYEEVVLSADECNRPQTTLEQLGSLKPVMGEGTSITAGNASQLSDGASAMVVMDAKVAEQQGLSPLGAMIGMVSCGCEPGEMGIGPVYAIPKLLKRHGLSMDDIGLWEINEAFASQLVYCRDHLNIPHDRLNVNGGAISIGHPYGMTGARMAGHVLLEGKRRGVKYGVVSMCVGGGQGSAGLFEIY